MTVKGGIINIPIILVVALLVSFLLEKVAHNATSSEKSLLIQ